MTVDVFKMLKSDDGNYSIVVFQTAEDTFLVLEKTRGVDICWEYETLGQTLKHYVEFVDAHKEEFRSNN